MKKLLVVMPLLAALAACSSHKPMWIDFGKIVMEDDSPVIRGFVEKAISQEGGRFNVVGVSDLEVKSLYS